MILIILISFGLIFSTLSSIQAQEAYPSNLEIEIHTLINEERLRSVPNFPQLVLHSVLIEIARTYSKYLFDENHFDHVDKDGNGPGDRLDEGGIKYSMYAENLYWSRNIVEPQIAESAVSGWIQSAGHYENMKSLTSYTGIGVYHESNIYYITQIFVEASDTHMRSVGLVYDNVNLQPLSEPSITEKYKIEILVFGLIVTVVLLGKKAESLNRRSFQR
ncbi:MAG: hypothetical protein HeimC2_10260 [Candidatus Heimdallarchaeota archaeon LC_2]|nr:MAG: hypothetical protein HeimC2_10260 [Candidatus Heimdallarchaeota archaeon LC_2]